MYEYIYIIHIGSCLNICNRWIFCWRLTGFPALKKNNDFLIIYPLWTRVEACPNMDVSKNSGFSPQIIHLNRVFHYIHHPFCGYPYFKKHPYLYIYRIYRSCTSARQLSTFIKRSRGPKPWWWRRLACGSTSHHTAHFHGHGRTKKTSWLPTDFVKHFLNKS